MFKEMVHEAVLSDSSFLNYWSRKAGYITENEKLSIFPFFPHVCGKIDYLI